MVYNVSPDTTSWGAGCSLMGLKHYKIHKDCADKLATNAHEFCQGYRVTRLPKYYEVRLDQYTNLIVKLQCLIVRVYLAIDTLRKSDAFALTQKSGPRHTCVTPQVFLSFESGAPCVCNATIHDFDRHLGGHPQR